MRGAESRPEGTDGSTERSTTRGLIRAYAPPGPMRRRVVAWAARYAWCTGAHLELLVEQSVHRVVGASRADRLVRAAAGARLLVIPQRLPEAAELVDRAYEPVVVVPEDDPRSDPAPVVVALAGRTGDEVLDAAFAESVRQRAPLLALRVREGVPRRETTGKEAVQADADERRAWEDHLSLWHLVNPDVTVTTRVTDGDPLDVLVEQSRTSRLLVLGRSGRGRLLGALHSSPVAGVARTARCPVLVVPPIGPPRRPWWPRSR